MAPSFFKEILMALPSGSDQVYVGLPGNSGGNTLGNATTDKISFYGVTPVVQRSGSAQTTLSFTIKHTNAYGFSTSAQATAVKKQLAEICATLKTLGLWAGS